MKQIRQMLTVKSRWRVCGYLLFYSIFLLAWNLYQYIKKCKEMAHRCQIAQTWPNSILRGEGVSVSKGHICTGHPGRSIHLHSQWSEIVIRSRMYVNFGRISVLPRVPTLLSGIMYSLAGWDWKIDVTTAVGMLTRLVAVSWIYFPSNQVT